MSYAVIRDWYDEGLDGLGAIPLRSGPAPLRLPSSTGASLAQGDTTASGGGGYSVSSGGGEYTVSSGGGGYSVATSGGEYTPGGRRIPGKTGAPAAPAPLRIPLRTMPPRPPAPNRNIDLSPQTRPAPPPPPNRNIDLSPQTRPAPPPPPDRNIDLSPQTSPFPPSASSSAALAPSSSASSSSTPSYRRVVTPSGAGARSSTAPAPSSGMTMTPLTVDPGWGPWQVRQAYLAAQSDFAARAAAAHQAPLTVVTAVDTGSGSGAALPSSLVPAIGPVPVVDVPLPQAMEIEPIPGLQPAWSWTSLLAVAAALGVGYLLLQKQGP